MKFNAILKSVAVATAFVALGSAHAGVIKFKTPNVDTGIAYFYDNAISGTVLNASVKFSLSTLTATSAVFDVVVANNSTGPGQNYFTGFGITVIDPSVSAAVVSGGNNWIANTSGVQFPGGGYVVDLCTYAVTCGGSAGDFSKAVGMGSSQTFTLTLTAAGAGDFLSDGIAFGSPFYANFEQVSIGNKKVGVQEQYDVPEPSSIALAGLMLTGLAASRRLAKRKSA